MDTSSRSDVAVVFYNVVEMAREAKIRKQFEEETELLKSNRTAEELDAAFALVMMRYQAAKEPQRIPTRNCSITRELSGGTRQRTLMVYGLKRRRDGTLAYLPTGEERVVDDDEEEIEEEIEEQEEEEDSSSESKYMRQEQDASASSLIKNCKNLLKQYLNQNSNFDY